MKKMYIGGHYVNHSDLPFDVLGLVKNLENLGFSRTTCPEGAILINFEHDPLAYRKFIAGGGDCNNAYLVRIETDSVLPRQYRSKISKLYKEIFTMGSVEEDFGHGKYLHHPFEYMPHQQSTKLPNQNHSLSEVLNEIRDKGFDEYEQWQSRPLEITAITSNKAGHSNKANFLFRMRYLRECKDSEFHLFGPNWDGFSLNLLVSRLRGLVWSIRSFQLRVSNTFLRGIFWKYPRNCGRIHDKYELLKKSRFTLVFENSDNFLTEKIPEAMVFGAIPIYFGTRIQDFSLPEGSFISFSKDTSPISVTEYVRGLTPENIQSLRQKAFDFVTSENFIQYWTSDGVYREIAHEISREK